MANNLSSVSVAAFKQQLGINSIELLVNPHTSKKFCSTDTGFTFKAEQAIDVTKEMVILVDSADSANPEYTLINKKSTVTVLATL